MGTEHKEINTTGQTKQESDLWPLDWRPFASLLVCFIFKQKMKEKQVAKLGNRSFGLSRDEFLKSVKKFLVKKVRTIPFNSRSRPPPPSQYPSLLLSMVYFTMLGPDRLIFLESMASHFFASAREAYKSLACRNLCIIMLLLLWRDTGPAGRILGNTGALQTY